MLFKNDNAPASFNNYSIKFLIKEKNLMLIIYLNHIFFYNTNEIHIRSIYEVMYQLEKCFFYLNKKKSCFLKEEILVVNSIKFFSGILIEYISINAFYK